MMRLEFSILNTGSCFQMEAMTRRGAPWRVAEFPAMVALIVHPARGVALFDTGYSETFLQVTESFPERAYRIATPTSINAENTALRQIERMGIRPVDVGTVILSHFHGDHAGGLHDFPNAQIVCSRAGLREIQSIGRFSGIRRGLLPALLPAGMERHAVFVEDLARVPPPSSLAPFGDCVDIFGDHSCLGVPLPGHAIGQFGVFFTDTQDRAVFLIADAAFSMTSVRTGVLPPAIAGFLLGHSPEYAKTLRRVHDAARIDRDMLVVPSHCTERCAELAA